ncbi:hypothetical protein HanHA300_Chr04g0128201 [Helianthus annuus]|nr:hypothetical protein HanHA300_Chr04g0128201 [Helianthus annuus]
MMNKADIKSKKDSTRKVLLEETVFIMTIGKGREMDVWWGPFLLN